MRFRYVPVTESRCFIFIKAQVNAKPYLLHARLELKISRSVINRIASDHDEHVYLSRIHLLNKLAQFIDGIKRSVLLSRRAKFERVCVTDSVADAAECL